MKREYTQPSGNTFPCKTVSYIVGFIIVDTENLGKRCQN